MFQAYIDDSGKGDSQLFVLAGYIATVDRWAAFSDEWQRLLDMRSPHYRHLTYFKMNEMQSDADRERCAWFHRVIEKYAQAAISCVIVVPGLEEVINNAEWAPFVKGVEYLKNPYYFAFRSITDVLRQNQAEMGIDTPVDFYFDDEGEKTKCLNGLNRLVKTATEEKRRWLAETPAFRNDKNVLPLQAADLYAWWVLNWERNGIDDGVWQQRFSWEVENKDFLRLHMKFDAQGIKENLDKIFGQQAASRIAASNAIRKWRFS